LSFDDLKRFTVVAGFATLLAGCSGGGGRTIPASSLQSQPTVATTTNTTPAPTSGSPAPGSSASPAPKQSPTASPGGTTATPTPAPISPAGQPAPNGVEWPASFRPYGATSIWNRAVPSNASRFYQGSDAIIALAEQGDPGPTIRSSEYGAGNDYSHPVVFASTSDPVVTAHCTLYCDAAQDFTLHIPAKALPAGGQDHHLAVIQPDGTEDDFWGTQWPGRDWHNGDTLNYAGDRGTCGNFYTGSGFTTSGATAGGACLAGGLIRAAELLAGTINHAVFLGTACTDPQTWVWPASQVGRNCVGGGPHVPNGAHIWLDIPDSQIASMGLPTWQKAVLTALHDYGGFIMDGGGQDGLDHTTGVLWMMLEDDAQFAAFGQSSPYAQLNWSAINVGGATRYIGADPWNPGVNWSQHLHVLDPCYAQGSC
jgi:hypothetical protein